MVRDLPLLAYYLLMWYLKGLPTGPIFLPFMSRLRFLQIDIGASLLEPSELHTLSFLLRSLQISLTSPPTLEHLKCDITLCDDPMVLDDFHQELRDADIWKHLDSITTCQSGSKLQRVDIGIAYPFCEGDGMPDPDMTADQLGSLVSDGLPLLEEKGILFVTLTPFREGHS